MLLLRAKTGLASNAGRKGDHGENSTTFDLPIRLTAQSNLVNPRPTLSFHRSGVPLNDQQPTDRSAKFSWRGLHRNGTSRLRPSNFGNGWQKIPFHGAKPSMVSCAFIARTMICRI